MNLYILTGMCVFCCFLIVFSILQTVFRDKLRVLGRISRLTTPDKAEAREKKVKKKKRERKLDTRFKILKKLAAELSVSGVLMKPSEFLFVWALATLVPSSLCLVFSFDFVVALAALLVGLFLPPFIVHIKKVKRIELFEKQLIDAMAIISNSLRSGLTFLQALESISSEMPEPISREFGRAIREMKLGNSIDKALGNMGARLSSKDFNLIVSAVLIQRQIGGNLSEILYNLAGTIKERYDIKSEIKVLTATGRTSGYIVGAMPILILLFFMIANPGYVRSFFDQPMGIALLVLAAVLETLGFIIINKVVNIKF